MLKVGLAAAACFLLVIACTPEPPPQRIVEVVVDEVVNEPYQPQSEYVGRLHAKDDVAIQANVGQPAISSTTFARVLLGFVTQFADLRMTEHRIVIKGHFGIKRDHTIITGHDQRVDFNHRRIQFGKRAITPLQCPHHLADQPRSDAKSKRDLTGLEILQTNRRFNR